jgi:hypothetical protein
MTDEVAIEYQLGQHGWSQFRLTVGDASTVVGEFGYCTDALGEVPSRVVLEFADASSGGMRLSDHAARSMI